MNLQHNSRNVLYRGTWKYNADTNSWYLTKAAEGEIWVEASRCPFLFNQLTFHWKNYSKRAVWQLVNLYDFSLSMSMCDWRSCHLFRQRLGAKRATSHYKNQCWTAQRRIYVALTGEELVHGSETRVYECTGLMVSMNADDYSSCFHIAYQIKLRTVWIISFPAGQCSCEFSNFKSSFLIASIPGIA